MLPYELDILIFKLEIFCQFVAAQTSQFVVLGQRCPNGQNDIGPTENTNVGATFHCMVIQPLVVLYRIIYSIIL